VALQYKQKTLPWEYQASQCWGQSEELHILPPIASALSQASHHLHKCKCNFISATNDWLMHQ
jgi:hypothetical protein